MYLKKKKKWLRPCIFSHNAKWFCGWTKLPLEQTRSRRMWTARMGEGLFTLGHFALVDLYLWMYLFQKLNTISKVSPMIFGLGKVEEAYSHHFLINSNCWTEEKKGTVNSCLSLRKKNANEEPVVFNLHIYNYELENKNIENTRRNPRWWWLAKEGKDSWATRLCCLGEDRDLETKWAGTLARRVQLNYICTNHFKPQDCFLIINKKLRVQEHFAFNTPRMLYNIGHKVWLNICMMYLVKLWVSTDISRKSTILNWKKKKKTQGLAQNGRNFQSRKDCMITTCPAVQQILFLLLYGWFKGWLFTNVI